MLVFYVQLKVFYVVVVYGSFMCVVECLFFIQLVVFDQVCKLEECYGVLLFYCNKCLVCLSELGECLFVVIQWLFVIEVEVEELLFVFSVLQIGILILVVDVLVYVLLQIVCFCECYLGIVVWVEIGNIDEFLQ